MGGASGRLDHLYDDVDLTFDELRRILVNLSVGLTSTYEKFDGTLNIWFRRNPDDHTKLQFARSITDARKNPLSVCDLENRIRSSNQVGRILHAAGTALEKLITGRDTTSEAWLSADIISKDEPNVINYGKNVIAIHPIGYDLSAAKVRPVLIHGNVQDPSQIDGWHVIGPRTIDITLPDATIYINAAVEIMNLTNNYRGDLKLGDYYSNRAAARIRSLNIGLPDHVVEMTADRIIEVDGHPTLTEIKKKAWKSDGSVISELVNNHGREIKRFAVTPVEQLIRRLGSALFADKFSTLLPMGHYVEAGRINKMIEKTIERNPLSKVIVENKDAIKAGLVPSSIEGVVFLNGNKFYKLVGDFSVINQIVGIERHNR